MFSELYEWAGKIRTIDISKGGTRFCTCSRIVAESSRLFALLQEDNWLRNLEKPTFCEKLAEHYIEFNMIHPFREGNGRVQRLLFEHITLVAGYDLNWSDVSQDEWIKANLDGVRVNYKPMEKIFRRIVRAL
ncbi:Fic family protein [Pasteurella skyensis]|uniref:protein adenylyltransferase n=1 Tax=Phocoenobacter skyensis TaxID=97481 RepID=A0AAJ6N954_9PAST|nr:Fic family protein [Pasteurella skyensis]MDP8162536.1 Fic family protein [Pasteurella skyensis]MDP8172501.1 Fic family protein [Pasteurella skyensis]MDP8177526.1 Fic family protein [Pasteurella skyensis]MDP8178756.1 Fic family protein [Pasteurella skyensis]MDP8182954.1 Fic family protein [Pasteurella skyensis]